MIRILIVAIVVVVASLVLAPPTAQRKPEPPSILSPTSELHAKFSAVNPSVEQRRRIFCGLVEEVKKAILPSLSRPEIISFDLSTSEQKWDFLKPSLLANGCPDESVLPTSLGVNAVSEIEFGTMDGADPCSISPLQGNSPFL